MLYKVFLSYLLLDGINGCNSQWRKPLSPALQFRPKRNDEETLIWYNHFDRKTVKPFIQDLDLLLKPYATNNHHLNAVDCSSTTPPKDKFCYFDIHQFGPCKSELDYGFTKSSPCIFLKLTNIPQSWIPQLYNVSNLPKEAPKFVKSIVSYHQKIHNANPQILFTTCEGENAADKEFIGPISYFPQAGFDTKYLLNRDVEGYLIPLLAVHFERPERGVIIMVRCTIWAKNVPRNVEQKLGTVHFELFID